MPNNHLCDLNDCFLCQSCLKDWLPLIALNKKKITVNRGQLLFKEGDPVTGIFFVAGGTLKVHKKWDNEKELIIRFAKGGDIVGHLGLGNLPSYPVSATAINKATICYVDLEFFNTSLNINHQLSIKVMRFFANELQESEKRMRNLVHMTVKGRVAQALINLKKQFGLNEQGIVNIEITRQDLASYSGAVYESLFRTINDFTERDIVTITGKSIMIKDEAMLLKLIEEDSLKCKKMGTIQIKRIYEPAEKKDGKRILVDRLWPRGVKKELAHLNEWMKVVAPSVALRKWFDHDPAKWEIFSLRYTLELKQNEAVNDLIELAKHNEAVTLLYGAHDEKHNHALILQQFLAETLNLQ